MIACLFGEKRVVVSGTVREWIAFVERLDPQVLAKGDEASKAREILVAAAPCRLTQGTSVRVEGAD